MWPKRKKGKARTTKLKLKAMQPPGQEQDQPDIQYQIPPEANQPEAKDPRAAQDDLVSGVWKSKVLTNYKQNPKNSHTLLARIPTGKAAFEAGERQKAELIKEAMIKVVDRMFDNFQNTAYEFNQVTAGTNLELTWIRPHFVQEEASNWHETTRVMVEVFSGRISTRYWTLAVRGTASGVETYILPSDKLLGFSTSPTSYPTYLSIAPESDGLAVDWLVAKKPINPDILPSIYRALLDGLIRFASDEAQPGEAFRLEDIGIVAEAATPTQEPVGYQSQDQHDLLGQSAVNHPAVSVPHVASTSADRFIDSISNQVAQAAQSETDKFRESLQAPPFGTNTRAPGGNSQSTARSNSLQPQDMQQTPGFQQAPPAFQSSQNLSQSGACIGNGSEQTADDDFGQWKSVSSDQAVKAEWRQFMESTRSQLKTASPPASDDNWNAVPGTEKLARPDAHTQQPQHMSSSQVMQGMPYPSYGNADDPPELLRPSAGYANHPSQSGVDSTQMQPSQPGGYPGQQAVGPSGVYSAQQANQSGVFSGPQSQMPPQMPPQMMPPGYNQQMAMPQQLPGMIQPGLVNHPGLPSMPGMINPAISQSGVHQQPMQPQPPQGLVPGVTPPPGLTLPHSINPPQGMIQMPPQMVPGYQGDLSGQYANQSNTGGHAVPPQYVDQQRSVLQQSQSNTGAQQALSSQYNTGAHQAQPTYNQAGQPNQSNQYNTGAPPAQPAQYNTGAQPAQPAQYSSGSQQALPPQYNSGSQPTSYETGAQQPQPQYNSDAHQQLQYAQGGYDNYAQTAQQPSAYQPPEEPAEDQSSSYPDSESDFSNQDQQYLPDSEQLPEEGGEESWQPEEAEAFEEISIEVEEANWEEPANSPFANSSFPQESFDELPVMSSETLQKFEAANKSGFGFSSENDLVDAINVVLATIDSQIELLAQQGTEAFRTHDFRRAQAIIKLSERLTSFKSESQAILQLMAENEE